MQLNKAQLEQYDRDGYLFFPELFRPQEVKLLLDEVERITQLDDECVIKEGDLQFAKIMFRLHEADGSTASAPFRAALRTPRALGVAQQIMGDDALYLHHCKVNMKAAIQGSAWPWHQDFGSWHLDGIAQARLMTMGIFLHEATAMNGCLHFLPGSHKANRVDPYFDESTAYKLWAVGPSDMCRLMAQYPEPVALTGAAGSVAFFHCNLLHASGHNLSPSHRVQAYFCFNPVSNHPTDVEKPRPDYVRSTNWKPLTLGANEFLQAEAVA